MPAPDPTTEDQHESPGSDDPDSSPPNPRAAAQPIIVELALHIPEIDPPITGWLEVQLARAAKLAGVTQAQLSLAVVDDTEMAQLHEQYTGVAGTTDVLTFDLAEADSSAGATGIEGDIVVCIDEAARQAQQRGHPVHHELLLYAVHGLMHLLGEDDHSEADYQRMHAREDALLKRMGYGPVFDPDRDERTP